MKSAILALMLCGLSLYNLRAQSAVSHYTAVSGARYGYNATLTCRVMDGTDIVNGVEVAAFTTGSTPECRGTAFVDASGICYLTIVGDTIQTLHLRIWDPATSTEYLSCPFVYKNDQITGTPDEPYRIPLLWGDVDGDRTLSNDDANLLLDIILNKRQSVLSRSDIDGDNRTSVADLVRLIELLH